MGVYKASLHIGKGNANHNDRSFDKKKNKSITDTTLKNGCWVSNEEGKFVFCEEGKHAFQRREKEYYKSHFKGYLKAKNDRYIANGHKEKCQSISGLYTKQQPTEMIFQVGNKKNLYEDQDRFTAMCHQMIVEIRKKYPNFVILDFAIHIDEGEGCHCHLRGVFVGHDKEGNLQPSQADAFREMGIERPNPEEATSKLNCPLQTFTDELRARWEDLIEELDPEIQIDRERKTPGRKHQDHKIYNLEKEIEALQKQVRTLRESESVRYKAMERFIDERGLTDEFEAFYESVYASQYDDAEEGIDIISDDDFGEEML